MNAIPPGPFSWITTAQPGEHDGTGHVYIVGATGRKIATVWGPKETKVALAEMIVQARNEKP